MRVAFPSLFISSLRTVRSARRLGIISTGVTCSANFSGVGLPFHHCTPKALCSLREQRRWVVVFRSERPSNSAGRASTSLKAGSAKCRMGKEFLDSLRADLSELCSLRWRSEHKILLHSHLRQRPYVRMLDRGADVEFSDSDESTDSVGEALPMY